jgi:hypothetical protein
MHGGRLTTETKGAVKDPNANLIGKSNHSECNNILYLINHFVYIYMMLSYKGKSNKIKTTEYEKNCNWQTTIS